MNATMTNVRMVKDTSRITRNNILVFWLTTPFVIALQYFGADRPIFPSFEQNPKNFILSLIVLGTALPLITCAINLIERLLPMIGKKKVRNLEENESKFGPPYMYSIWIH